MRKSQRVTVRVRVRGTEEEKKTGRESDTIMSVDADFHSLPRFGLCRNPAFSGKIYLHSPPSCPHRSQTAAILPQRRQPPFLPAMSVDADFPSLPHVGLCRNPACSGHINLHSPPSYPQRSQATATKISPTT
jgi:hypothetical protein